MIHKCKSHGKGWCRNCLVATVGFPLEHFVWEKLPLFMQITHALGL